MLDDKDLWIYLRRRIRELNLNYFVRAASVSKFFDDLLAFFRHCHDELVGPEKYEEYVQRLERGELPVPRVTKSKDADSLSDEEVVGRCREIASVFTTVERMLREDNLGTFGHMITNAYHLLQQDSELASRSRSPLHPGGRISGRQFCPGQGPAKTCGRRAQRFRGRRSGPGDLSLPRGLERRLRSLSAALSRRQPDQIGEKSPLAVAHPELRFRPDFQKSECVRRGDPVRPHTSVRSWSQPAKRMRRGLASELPRVPVEAVVLTAKDTECRGADHEAARIGRKTRCQWSDCAVLYRTHVESRSVGC